jgi:long-chain acyl-CoA synthetase
MYLTQGLHRALQQCPERTATIFAGQHHSFRTFGDRVARLASALRTLGVQPGDRVAMLAHNSDCYAEFFLAVWWAGAVANPVNTRWSAAEIAYSLNDCESAVLLVDDAFAAQVPAIRQQATVVRTVVHTGDADISEAEGMLSYEALLQAATPMTDAGRRGDDLAVILYTGGTTGFPKGVMLSHANLWSAAVARLAELPNPSEGISLLVAPLFHVAGLGRLVSQIVIGATSVIEPVFRADTVLNAIEQHGVNDVVLVPSMLQMLLDHPAFEPTRLRSLQRIVHGASPMSPALLDRAMQALPHVGFITSYGMTETSAVVSLNGPIAQAARSRFDKVLRSVGRAGYGCEVRIVDGQGQPVPPGTVGEITVRGPGVMLGYWNKPAETACALRDGWLYTGDGAWMNDSGYLHVVDRLKDMIISGGENVYSAEVEAALMLHPAVASCAVIGVPSEQWGEAVHAVVVLRPGCQADEQALRAHCRTRLAGYKCPKAVDFMAALPLSAAGKVMKNRLREPFWQGRSQRVN